MKQKTQTPVADLPGLSDKTINGLEGANIILCADLLTRSYAQLIDIPNIGDKTIAELRTAVRAHGLPVPPAWTKPLVSGGRVVSVFKRPW